MSILFPPKFRRYVRWFWLLVITPVILLFLILMSTALGLFGELPTFAELENPSTYQATEIYSSDLKMLGKYYRENRSLIHYEDLSPNLVNALKATEDIRFEEHSGVDIRGLIRAVFNLGSKGGGSTLTQQLAKNLFHETPHTKVERIKQKIQEWIISVRLERSYTKHEILAMYLNTVEFGANAFGIRSASTTFFKKEPISLSIEEAALLVGMLQAPTRYNPVHNNEAALQRRNVVLSQMQKYKFITDLQFDMLKRKPITLKFEAEGHSTGPAPYFRETLRLELNKWCHDHKKADGTSYNLYTDGLRIYTTIDSRMQRYAEEAVKEHLTALQKEFFAHWKGQSAWKEHPEIINDAVKKTERYRALKDSGATEADIKKIFDKKVKMTLFSWKGERDTLLSPLDSVKYYKMFLQTGFMSMEPQTGYIRAWVGGDDYKYFQYDHVKEGKRQVGSTFKAFLYTLAMQEGFSPCYKVPNVPVTITDPKTGVSWTPTNSDGKYGGMLTLKQALAESVNCISAYLMKQFGPEAMIQIARKMGITSPIEPYPSIALGTPDVSVFEMVGAYSTFANKGVWVEPQYLLRIEDKNGVVLQDFVPKKVEAISEETAYLMLNLMKGVVDYGTSSRLRWKFGFTNPGIAGKTGTSQNQSDGWFMGITPELVSGLWTGCEDRSIHFRTTSLGQGANVALPVWAFYMKKVYADPGLNYSKEDFEKPEKPLSVELDCSKYETPGNDGSHPDFGL
ncbi:MAG: transglycosylase domain-containing protein [Bacteroidota bacterium]